MRVVCECESYIPTLVCAHFTAQGAPLLSNRISLNCNTRFRRMCVEVPYHEAVAESDIRLSTLAGVAHLPRMHMNVSHPRFTQLHSRDRQVNRTSHPAPCKHSHQRHLGPLHPHPYQHTVSGYPINPYHTGPQAASSYPPNTYPRAHEPVTTGYPASAYSPTQLQVDGSPVNATQPQMEASPGPRDIRYG